MARKLSNQALENKKAYNREYAKKNFKSKLLYFNTQNLEDVVLLEWLQMQENGVQYIKNLIKEDLLREQKIGA